MRIAVLCAGQGGQHPAMFDRLAQMPAAARVLELASAHAGFDVTTLPACDPDTFTDNRLAQLLVVTHALAASAALRAEGVDPVLYAGYSVGEMAAHGAAGVWDADTTLELTACRAACMDEAAATHVDPLGMSAVLGLAEADVARLAEAAGVAVAIFNGVRHLVVGGPLPALSRFEEAALRYGASHLRRLEVRIASHTPFIADAAASFADLLSEAPWQAPIGVLLSGLEGDAIKCREDTVKLLSRQIHASLRWHDCLEAMLEYGVDAVLEIGPGRALTKMMEEAYPAVPVHAFDEFRSAAGAARWLARAAAA
jgi:[acyl-carrier-protein] S-malonyltransferase